MQMAIKSELLCIKQDSIVFEVTIKINNGNGMNNSNEKNIL